MHIHRPLLAILVSVAVCACQRVDAPPPAESRNAQLQVVRAEFGLFNKSEGGKLEFVPSKAVPLSVGQSYGWVVAVTPKRAKIKWREEFTLPSAPSIWGNQASAIHTISQDRTVSVTEREVEPINGVIANSWAVAEGDPRGLYVIRVTVENSQSIVFEFNVE